MLRRLTIAATLALAVATLPFVAQARQPLEPADYRKVSGLSQPDFPRIGTEVHKVAMADGRRLHVEVTLPDPGVYGRRRWPVILEASPYHGTIADRKGTRILPDPVGDKKQALGMTGYFAPRGYAVVMVDLRGTGLSDGCLDQLGQADASDLKQIVEWAADQPWSTGRVGMTGHSYVGSTPIVAAAQRPRGLVTIVPSAGLASMYDHQFQRGVPYSMQWVGPMEAYQELALERDLPVIGERFGQRPAETGCGLPSSALTAGHGQVNGQYQAWHAARDHRAQATGLDIPVFMVHGVNDDAARIPAAEWFFGHRFERRGDKVWIGQWDHGSSGSTTCSKPHPNCRFNQWTGALHAWFDRHLQLRRVDTGPAVEAFLDDEKVAVGGAWTAPRARIAMRPDPGLTLGVGDAPVRDGSVASTTPIDITFLSAPVDRGVLMLGLPEMDLDVSVTAPAVHLVVRLERLTARGAVSPITHCAIQPQLRDGVEKTSPVVPAQRMRLRPQCFTAAHLLSPGDRVRMVVSTTSDHHVPTAPADARITVFTGPNGTSLRLPVVDLPVHQAPALR